jgi:hypothetical protein
MPKITLRADMFRTPDRYVSDGKYSPEGTISFRHMLSIEGQSAKLYADTDLTQGLNGSAAKIGAEPGVGVPVNAVVDLYVSSGGKLTAKLLELREVKG